jgi:hypothetical protein
MNQGGGLMERRALEKVQQSGEGMQQGARHVELSKALLEEGIE